ncbi:ATP-dependent zinc metalloprotease FTSH 1 [Plasmodium gonderi]|uniref:ATP-dependent zinc metalloprotease FTSH 1 n=1 Tax=Plasmodium gonderi TaxID=77519 RepID=A0A1Y1JSJ3_PLAGO|nr:ATP-dependent zinc metalloprotease FTSH 1 [Plasmodium gonderi]GAW83772.1 ATP-dependent zinc metalloprotease FTSH 1 [Plasmodium gonderi]
MFKHYKNTVNKIMNSKHENESFVSTGSDKNCEEENSSLLQNNDTVGINKKKTKKSNNDTKKYKYYENFFNKKRNKKWNYFIIFFLGICFGFAIWPFFMTIITYKLFYKDNFNNSNFTTSNTSASLRPYGNDKNKKGDNGKVSIKDQTQKNSSPHFRPIRFEEIAGIDESKLELLEVVDFIRNRERYQEMGARMPKGVLLVGPPGSGKTMLARAVATEANVPYIYTSGPEFIEIYVGQGAKRIRQLFSHARSVAPSIVFIDEIDAIGGKRSSGSVNGAGQREHDQTLNQLLVEMDGFSNTVHIMVIGATNRIDTLDSALLRPGRFDRIVYVPLPDVNGRKRILEIYIKKIKSDLKSEDIEKIARLTPGFSGADLENVVNEATILATRNKKSVVSIDELFEARDKVSMGPERKSLRQSEHQRRITAYHEAGHAIVAYFLQPKTDPIHKATIISRGNALGYVEQIPVDDRHNYFKSQMEAKLAVCMGGRTAEEIVFGKSETSSGASSDISRATEIAYKMVTEWGMSDKLGPLNYKKRMGDGYSSNRLSAQTISTIEVEVKALVEKGKSLSEEILRRHRKELDNLAFALLDKETLSGEEIKKIIDPNNTRGYSDTVHLLSKDTKADTSSSSDNNKKEKNSSDNEQINDKNHMDQNTPNNRIRIIDTHGNREKDIIKNKEQWEKNKNEVSLTSGVKNTNNDDLHEGKGKKNEKYERKNNENNVFMDNSKIEIIRKNAKNATKKIKKKYAKDANVKNSKILKTVNEHKSYDADRKVDEQNFENKNGPSSKSDKHSCPKGHPRDSNNSNNVVKNTNELFNKEFSEEKNKNENLDFVKTKEITFNNFNEVVDTSNIKNANEMKKFNIFEHNLSKLFLFDIFSS